MSPLHLSAELQDAILDHHPSMRGPPRRTILVTHRYRFPNELQLRNHFRHDFAAYYYGTTTFHFISRDLIRPFLAAMPSEHRRMIHTIRFSYNADGRSHYHVELQVFMLRQLLGPEISRDLRDRQFEVGSVVPGYGDHYWERGHGFKL